MIALIQARMGSTRLPGKVLKPIAGMPMIGILLSRLAASKRLEKIIVATSTDSKNDALEDYVQSLGYDVFRGSEEDVLDRFYQAARQQNAKTFLRITADCPLVDPVLVDQVIDEFERSGADYCTNTNPPTYPDGLDIEVFSFSALERAWQEAVEAYDREHVTPYIYRCGKFNLANVAHSEDCSAARWTVDEPEDFAVIKNVFEYFQPRIDFTWQEVWQLLREQPDLFAANQNIGRNEGATMSKGQKLWKRAKRVIPGGNMLLSKRAEMFLPDQWPAYFSKAKGCKVWDLEGNEYIDTCIMGIGTNILGYGHPEVDDAVRATVDAGNMSTLNCPEEVYLAEKLIELHPWADMVRFARSGGEANAIAIRIARAAAGKSQVAVCGYHGWHDWYLAANLSDDENLAGHLLPGLEPKGVPENLRGTIFPFNYNRFDELQKLVAENDIGVIKMEVSRNHEPAPGFLESVRQLATEKNIVLVFDECSSGFRQSFGGLHKVYGVEPDMAMFGKALGNGYAITATIGKREIMDAAQATFISSTFWTERIGPTAGLKTLEVMERTQSWDVITQTGRDLKQRWQKLAEKHDLNIEQWGLPALAGYSFCYDDALAYKTLVTQEMLAKGYLSGNSIYVCTEHTPDIIDGYFAALDPLFGLVRECVDGRDVNSLLRGPVCHGGFKRLN